MGNSDWQSLTTQVYEKSTWDLPGTFEDDYVSLIKTIRLVAYPKYSGGTFDLSPNSYLILQAVSDVPIFVMRPLRGQLEGAAHSVVEKLRKMETRWYSGSTNLDD
jgi:hypothetical protein